MDFELYPKNILLLTLTKSQIVYKRTKKGLTQYAFSLNEKQRIEINRVKKSLRPPFINSPANQYLLKIHGKLPPKFCAVIIKSFVYFKFPEWYIKHEICGHAVMSRIEWKHRATFNAATKKRILALFGILNYFCVPKEIGICIISFLKEPKTFYAD